MSEPEPITSFPRFRPRLNKLLRENKLAIFAELIIVLLITALYLADLIPLSETPFLFFFGWLSLRLRGIGWGDVGLRRPASWRKTLVVGIAAGVVTQFFSLYVLEPLIVRATGKAIDLSQFAQLRGNTFLLVIWFLLIWTLAAFGEEMVYRGYLMNRVADLAGGTRTAWMISLVTVNTLFGVIHMYQGLSGILTVIFAALVYGVLYLRTGRNLWVPIIAHGVYDMGALLLIFLGKYPGL